MSDDLIEQLRGFTACAETGCYDCTLMVRAADEIERLRAWLNEYENLYGPPWWLAESDGA